VRLQTASVAKLLGENGVTLEVSDTAVKFIAKAGFDPEFGARPIKRAIQRLLLNDLSKQLLAGSVDKEKPIKVDATVESLIFTNR
jgi:ATP-dependent Clp protease ATP-binding subunit ClpB